MSGLQKRKTLHFLLYPKVTIELRFRGHFRPLSLLEARFETDHPPVGLYPPFGPLCATLAPELQCLGWIRPVCPSLLKKNDRKWPRLHLAIPVFVRASNGSGSDSLEFATATNISPGGALVVLRRSLPLSSVISLEIPSAPIGPTPGLKTASRVLKGKAVWVTHFDGYHLLGLKFDRPLSTDEAVLSGRRLRKAHAAV